MNHLSETPLGLALVQKELTIVTGFGRENVTLAIDANNGESAPTKL